MPNDLQMNSNSLGYALQRISPAKVFVERANGVPDERSSVRSRSRWWCCRRHRRRRCRRGSVAAAQHLLSRPDWAVAARLTRGDGREIVILSRPAAGT